MTQPTLPSRPRRLLTLSVSLVLLSTLALDIPLQVLGAHTSEAPALAIPAGDESADRLVRVDEEAVLQIEARNGQGDAAVGIEVAWATDCSACSLLPPGTVTGTDGRTSTTFRASQQAGPARVVAALPDYPDHNVTFTVAMTAGDAAVVEAVGPSLFEEVVAGSEIPLQARVRDQFGNPVPTAPVQWLVSKGQGGLEPLASSTDENGIARANFQATPQPQETHVNVSSGDLAPHTFVVRTITRTLQNLQIQPSSAVTYAEATYAFRFTTSSTWDPNGTLRIQLPPHLEAPSPAATIIGCNETGPPQASFEAPSSVVVVRTGPGSCAPGEKRVELSGVNNGARSGPAEFRLKTLRQDGSELDAGEGIVELVPAAIPGLNVTTATPWAATESNYTFRFPRPVPWPIRAAIRISFPQGFGFTSRTSATLDSCGQGSTSELGTRTAIVRQAPSEVCSSPEIRIQLAFVTNPSALGNTSGIEVQVLDNGGNVTRFSTTVGIDLKPAPDRTPPSAVGLVTSDAFRTYPQWSNKRIGRIRWGAATDANGTAGYSYALDGPSDGTIDTTSTQADLVVQDGDHMFRVAAIDTSGNVGPVTEFRFRLDTEPPPVAGVRAEGTIGNCVREAPATVRWNATTDNRSGPAANYAVRMGAGPAAPTPERHATVPLGPGITTVTISWFDNATNFANRSLSLRRDLWGPEGRFLALPSVLNGTVNATWTSRDDCAGTVSYRLDYRSDDADEYVLLYQGGRAWSLFSPPTGLDGVFHLRLTGTDRLGRVGNATLAKVLVDRSPPSPPLQLSAASGPFGSIHLRWTKGSDDGSGIANYEIQRGPAAAGPFQRLATTNATAYIDAAATVNTTHHYRILALDGAGNRGLPSMVSSARADASIVAGASAEELERLTEILELPWALESLRVEDLDGDRKIDRLVTPRALRLAMQTTVEGAAAAIIASDSDLMALWAPAKGLLEPVLPTRGTVVSETEANGTRTFSVRTQKHAGWILLNIEDPRPGESLVSVKTGDGRIIPLEWVKRADGRLLVLDDPDVIYHLEFNASASALAADAVFSPLWIWLVGGAATCAVAAGTFLRITRRRRTTATATSPAGEPPPPNGMDNESGTQAPPLATGPVFAVEPWSPEGPPETSPPLVAEGPAFLIEGATNERSPAPSAVEPSETSAETASPAPTEVTPGSPIPFAPAVEAPASQPRPSQARKAPTKASRSRTMRIRRDR